MNTQITVFMVTAALLLAGCSQNPVENQPETPKFTVAKSDLVERESSPVPENLLSQQAADNNRFAVSLYKQLVEENKNCFISPYSITTALAMATAGAAGNTKDEMLTALQSTLPGIQFDEALNGIDQALTSYAEETEGITLSIVNSTWMQNGFDFSIGYLDHLSRYYGAGINMLDFPADPEACRTIINDWVAEQTHDKIPDLIPAGSIDGDTRAVLTNAVYFLADWQNSFSASLTKDETFYPSENTAEHIDVPMMHLVDPGKNVLMNYTRKSRVRALDFPYKDNRFVMTVLMPDFDSFPAFEQSLSAGLLDTIFSSMQPESLMVSLPKFKITYGTKSLKEALTSLGMKDAFSASAADFSAMGGSDRLFISDVVHKAFIAVDEKGTEAAAATGVVVSATGVNLDAKLFVVNRPFIFVIRDTKTNTVLFMGRVYNPLVNT